MRKLILRWLLGADFKTYNELFNDCVALLKYSRELAEMNQQLFEKCDKLTEVMEKAICVCETKGSSDSKNNIN